MEFTIEDVLKVVANEFLGLVRKIENYKKQKITFNELLKRLNGYNLEEDYSFDFNYGDATYTLLNNNGDFKISDDIEVWYDGEMEFLGNYHISDILELNGIDIYNDVYNMLLI